MDMKNTFRPKGLRRRKGGTKQLPLLLLLTPGALWLVIYNYLPMFGVVIAFKDFRYSRKGFLDALIKSEWVGLENFKFLFGTRDAMLVTRNTLFYNLAFIILGTIIAVGFAILMSQIRSKRVGKIYHTGIFLPYFMSWVVVSYFLNIFLNPQVGYLNVLMEFWGFESRNWYVTTQPWPGILIFMSIWKNTGYNAVFYLAGIVGIDRSSFEAAMLDGATRLQRIRYIILPGIMPLIIILTLLSIGRIFNADFGLFYQLPMNSGPLYPVTNVLDTYIFRALKYTGDIGMSAAAGLYQACVGFFLIIVSNWIVRRVDNEKSLF